MKYLILITVLLVACTDNSRVQLVQAKTQDCAEKDSLIKVLEKQVLYNLTRDDLELEDK